VVASGCATKGYVQEEVGRLEAGQAELRAEAERNRGAISQANADADAASRAAMRAESFARGEADFREADRYTVNFAFDSAELTPSAQSTLDEAAAAIAANRGYFVDIYGHADTTGDPAYNDVLSEWRAQNVLRYLLEPSRTALARFALVGMGESDPVMNGSSENADESRRVTVRLLEMTPAESGMQVSRTDATESRSRQ